MGRKPERAEPSSRDAHERLAQFATWMRKDTKIEWNDAVIRFDSDADACPGDAFGVWAASDIKSGDTLCTIPKSALLSIRNEGIDEILEAERFNGGLGLALAVMFQQGLGKKSKWYEYFRFLPEREYIPLFWTAPELALLQGTQVPAERIAGDLQNMREDFEEEVLPLVTKYPAALKKGVVTFDAFLRASAWMTSRSFFVDHNHGEALVPLADLFNHKASLIQVDASQYQIAELDGDSDSDSSDALSGGEGSQEAASDGDADAAAADAAADAPACAAAGCGRPEAPGPPPAKRRKRGDQDSAPAQEPVHSCGDACCGAGAVCGGAHKAKGVAKGGANMAPGADAGAGSGAESPAESQGGASGGEDSESGSEDEEAAAKGNAEALARAEKRFPGLNLKLEMWICDEEVDGEEALVIKAAQDVAKGAEIHNTYGEHGNAELLYKYGFVLEENPFDTVAVTPAELEAAAATVLGAKAAKKRMKFVRAQTDVMEEDGDAMSLAPRSVLSAPLAAVLLVLGAPDAVFQGWKGIADAVAWFNAIDRPSRGGAQADEADLQSGKSKKTSGGAEELDMQEVSVAESGENLTPNGLALLRSVVQQKLKSYPALADLGITQPSELAAIAALQGQSGDGPSATRFALLLRKTERALLNEFLSCSDVATL